MHRYYEYCAKCGGIRSLVVSIGLRKVPTADGGIEEILVRNYHCETCDSFIYSATDLTEQVAFFEMEPSTPQI
jgi:hypothetical protein